MKGPLVAALAAGTFAAVAFGGTALAAESGDPSVPLSVVVTTDAPAEPGEETPDDVASPGTGSDAAEHGLVCVLVPVETLDEADDEVPSIDVPPTADDIECAGTGNERSSEVALVPRYLAHSDDADGSEKGLVISTWAKGTSQKQSDEESEPTEPALDDGEPAPAPTAPGRSGEPHGNSGDNGSGGSGRGR